MFSRRDTNIFVKKSFNMCVLHLCVCLCMCVCLGKGGGWVGGVCVCVFVCVCVHACASSLNNILVFKAVNCNKFKAELYWSTV